MELNVAEKLFRRAGIALLALQLFAPVPGHAQRKIRLATLLPQGSSQYQALEEMGQEWRTASSGKITLTIYAGGTMGSEEEMVRRMRVGQIQAATLSFGGLSRTSPLARALVTIPMVHRTS